MRSDPMTNATQSPARGVEDEALMGSYEDAEAAFMARVDAWIALRQPIMANSAALKKRGVQEREATFQLANAAAFLGWHIRHRTPPAQPENGSGEVEKFAKIMRMACDNTRAIRGRAEVAVPTRCWHQLMDLCAALAIKGGGEQ